MKASIINKLDTLEERYQELAALLSDPEVIGDQKRFRKYSCEYAELEAVVACFGRYRQAEEDLTEAKVMLEDDDPDLREMGQEECEDAKQRMTALSEELQLLLLPKDPNDGRNIYLEIRAGAGGDEAAIFAGDLFRMYSRYAEKRRWKVEVLSHSDGEHGGYKEIITRVVGPEVYGHLKFESGGHRVQRVPETESQGRVHTSACTVAIIPEPDEQAEINIRREDLRIDTFRSSGAGGQHVNTTDSAVRLTHLPTGIVVECQDERSQHKNKARAMSLLGAKIEAEQSAKLAAETASLRKGLVGSGDRSERVRTYNYPQGRVSDHRINLTLYRLPEIVAGDLDCVVSPLRHEEQAEQLAALADND